MSHLQDVVPADRQPGDVSSTTWRAAAARIRTLEQRLPHNYLRCLAAVAVVYVTLYGTLLGITRGVPFVTDGNESFSMLTHASNLYHFPVSQSFGLSDEALSQDPAAHPYVYTHQGNFPRLFAFVLYIAGARSVESQIVITTFTVGLLSAFLIYHYISTIASAGFALLAVVVFLTDYLFFTQWQVNTYRVWHGLFFFLSLLCVHGLEGPHRRKWLALTFLNFACLFYFELAFGVFVTVMAGLYSGVRYWRRPRLLAQFWTVQCAGAAFAALVLVGQLIGYLGWADFLEDLRLTYTARNIAMQDPAYVERIREFVETRRLVFWYNFASVEYRRSAAEILSSITQGYFTAYTPTMWYFVTIVIAGWFAGFGLHRLRPARPGGGRAAAHGPREGLAASIPGLLLIIASARFLLAVMRPEALIGVGGPRLAGLVDQPWMTAAATALTVGGAGVIGRLRTGSVLGLQPLPAARVIVAAATLLLAEHLVLNSARLFDTFYFELWLQMHGTWFPGWIVQLAIVAAGGLAVFLVLNPSAGADTRWPSLASFLICGLVAYVAVYALSPGYVQSGYLQRWAPFGSFVLEMAIALAIYVAWRVVRAWLPHPGWRPALGVRFWVVGVVRAACLTLLLFPALFWTRVQATHARLLPATHFVFMKQLARPPFRSASFAADTYAAPIYAYTGEWAYFDTRLGAPGGATVSLTDDGWVADRDNRSYLWLADRGVNDAYQRPTYFLCFRFQDLRTAVNRIRGVNVGCATGGAVKHASERKEPSVAREIVARDPSGNDNWAIVSLDWSILEQRPTDSRHNQGLE